ncbi:MAG: Hsp20/alpha crystallin family protein [Verrucomicrobia bacterium]|nr:Hsp20/alpha crystallin family protein [Verrucomicrobiota bacterium]
MRIVRYNHPSSRSLAPMRSPWSGLETEMDRLFEASLGEFSGALNVSRFPVDLYEDKDNTYVRAELPGIDRSDLNVELVDGYLNIRATRKTREDGREEAFALSRSVSVPDAEVQTDKISATYENGILTVTLPKREEAKPRKVSVSVS